MTRNKPPKEIRERREWKPSGKSRKSSSEKSGWLHPVKIGIGIAASGIAVMLILGLKAGLIVSMGAPLDHNDVLTTPVKIVNNGLLALANVRVQSFEIRVKDARGHISRGNVAGSYTPPNGILTVGESETVPFKSLVKNSLPIVSANVAIIAFYRPAYMPFWRKRKAFWFKTFPEADGKLSFLELPSARDALNLYDRTIEELKRHSPEIQH
jgi:hypothetical protein